MAPIRMRINSRVKRRAFSPRRSASLYPLGLANRMAIHADFPAIHTQVTMRPVTPSRR